LATREETSSKEFSLGMANPSFASDGAGPGAR
jgi:hypothetical protein